MNTTNPSMAWVEHVKSQDERDNRPNILLMMTDQQRFDTICAAGTSFMQTPNLDRLIREGCLYTHGFTPNPICLPARSNMLTGLPARYHGLSDNIFGASLPVNLPTIPRLLSDNGYETRGIGKMHHLPPRRHNGFEKIELMEEIPDYREADEFAMYLKDKGWGHVQNIHGVRNLLYMTPQRSLLPEEHHGTAWVGNQSVDFIKTNQGRHPFFLFSSWIAPHPPFNIPDEMADLYKDVDFPAACQAKTPLSALSEENKVIADLPNPQYKRRMREHYYASITHVDIYVGKILDALEETGQLDKTLIFFVSDHGEMLGDQGLYQKWLPYDTATHIPFIIRFPKHLKAGSIKDEFVDLNDILPTVLDAAGIEYPGSDPLPGESLFAETPQKNREYQYVEYSYGNRRWVSLRNSTHKYNYYYGGGHEELFDLINDPQETNNLLHQNDDKSLLLIKNHLREKLMEFESVQGLEGTIEHSDFKVLEPYVPTPTRNRAFPRFPDKITNPQEKSEVNDFIDEVIAVVSKEEVVHLNDLDLQSWEKTGRISEQELEKVRRASR